MIWASHDFVLHGAVREEVEELTPTNCRSLVQKRPIQID